MTDFEFVDAPPARSNVIQGRYPAMPRGQFQARVHEGRCLVCFIGGEAQ